MNDPNLQKLLTDGMNQLNIEQKYEDQLWIYLQLLSKWNKTYNLTAITDFNKMITHHILDGLSVYPFVHGKTIIDVGTGAGIPGLILAIVDPSRHYTLIDAVGKKTRFLNHIKRELKLDNVTVIHDRIENYSPNVHYDVIISRAFSNVDNFLSLTSHLAGLNTLFMAMKGPKKERFTHSDLFSIKQSHILHVPFLQAERNLYVYQKVGLNDD